MQLTKLKQTDWKIFKDFWLFALKTNPNAFFSIYEEKVHEPDWLWQEKFTEIYENCIFAFENGQPIGLAGFYINSKTKSNHVAEIIRVFVSPNHRQQGIGKKIITQVISEIKTHTEITKINIQVVSSQFAAIKLYSNLGFTKVGCLHNEIKTDGKYYDEILMEMMLDSSYN